MPKHYASGRGLQEKILEGVNILADNVASTLGPRGRSVILYKASAPITVLFAPFSPSAEKVILNLVMVLVDELFS